MTTVNPQEDQESKSMSVFDEFCKEAQTTFKKAREEGVSIEEDFKAQQDLYQKFASKYDTYLSQDKTWRFQEVRQEMEGIIPDKTKALILDYGCATGTMADYLVKEHGFKNIDGLEPNQGLFDTATAKGTMRHMFQIGSTDDHSQLGDKTYDVLFSAGVFFVSPSHPDLTCLRKLCGLVKKGGYILICSGESYMKFVDMEPANVLEKEGKIRIFPQRVFEGYRRATPQEEGEFVNGVMLKYQVLC